MVWRKKEMRAGKRLGGKLPQRRNGFNLGKSEGLEKKG